MSIEPIIMKSSITGIFALIFTAGIGAQEMENTMKANQMNKINQEQLIIGDNSKRSVLARGCDPVLSLQFSKVVPQLIGNAEYVPTTTDVDFVEKLKSRKWSVVYFAPGACRYSAAKKQIPGGNSNTEGWTLDQYHELIYKLQGNEIQIVETAYESEAIELLNQALLKSREIN
jgi:hypothetical protein